jgi:hypothetical protein
MAAASLRKKQRLVLNFTTAWIALRGPTVEA